MRTPNGSRAHRHRARHVAEGDEAERLAHEPRDLQELRPAFLPPALAHHPVLHDQPPERGQDQHHGVIGDLLDERVGHVGDRDALGRRGGHVDRVHADAAERDDLAALQPVDHALGDGPALGVERVGVARGGGELLVALGGDLDDLGADRGERFQLVVVGGAGARVGDAGGGDHFELRHVRSSLRLGVAGHAHGARGTL